MQKVIRVEPRGDHGQFVEFDYGAQAWSDLVSRLFGPMGKPLRDPETPYLRLPPTPAPALHGPLHPLSFLVLPRASPRTLKQSHHILFVTV